MHCRLCGASLDTDRAETLLQLDIAWWDLCGPCDETQVHPPVTKGVDQDDFTRHLMAAHGYLELGLPLEAWNELEEIKPPQRRAEIPVLGLRVAIFHALERWEAMAEVCRHLVTVQPGELPWVMWLALATRHHEGIPAARDILLAAMVRFPKAAAISFNLACYAAQSGDLDDAKDCLRRALELDESLKLRALDEPDLAPLW